jgi:hypothetical protein
MKRLSLYVCLVLLLLLISAGIPIAAASPAITRVSPSSGPNNGVVTITVTGSGLDLVSVIRLNKCKLKTGGSSQAPFTGTIQSKSATSITATFDITGKIVGDYDVSVNAPYDNHDDWGEMSAGFIIYSASGKTPTATATAVPGKTAVTTATTVSTGDNSVFFQTDPTGAEIWLDGEDVGTSTFTYYTNHEGTFDVVVKKIGYEDYTAKVTILEGKRVSFMAPLVPLSSSDTSNVTPKSSATPQKTSGKNTPAIPKSSMKVPTPWGTDPPVTEESPVDPALALGAAGIAIGFVLLRRR